MTNVRIASAVRGIPQPGELVCVSKNGPVYRVIKVLSSYEAELEDAKGRRIIRYRTVWYDPFKLISWYFKRGKKIQSEYDAFLA